MVKENLFTFWLDKELKINLKAGILGALFAPLILVLGLFFSIILYPIFLGIVIANKIIDIKKQ